MDQTVVLSTDDFVVIVSEDELLAGQDITDVLVQPNPVAQATATIDDRDFVVVDSTEEVIIIGPDLAPPAAGSGASDASEVSYHDTDLPTVEAALDDLLYVAPQITGFSNNVGTVELGRTITAVNLSWSFNKPMTEVRLNGVALDDPTQTSASLTGLSLTGDTTYTLQATDGQNTVTATTSISFRRMRYWGASASDSLDNAAILALGGSEFATNFSKSITYDCTGGKYPYFAYPQSFGVPGSVTVGGLAFTDFQNVPQSFTNASGYTEVYNVLRFNGIQTGSSIKVVWA